MRRHARAVALEQYTWEVQRSSIVDLYRQLAREAAARAGGRTAAPGAGATDVR
jgi:hypothetical protein